MTKEDMILSEVREIRATQLEHVKAIAELRVKSGVWSAFVSAVVSLGVVLVALWK